MALKAQIEKIQISNVKSNNNTRNNGKHAWRKVPPKLGEITQEKDGKVWIWCKNHKAWCQHTFDDCCGVEIQTNKKDKVSLNVVETTTSNTSNNNQPSPIPTVQVNDALTSVITDGALRFR
jgi:hypothetical protein